MLKGTTSDLAKKAACLLVFFSLFLHCLYRIGVFTYFYMNQGVIAEEQCINRDKPQLNCKGQCYLNEMLSKADAEQRSLPSRHIQLQQIHLYFGVERPAVPSPFPLLLSMAKWRLGEQPGRYTFYRNSIFQPPRA